MNYDEQMNGDFQEETINPRVKRDRAHASTEPRNFYDETARERRSSDGEPKTFDGFTLMDPLLRRWQWLAISAVSLAVLGGVTGYMLWDKTYMVDAQLIRHQSSSPEEVLKPNHSTPQTFAWILRSPELLERVSGMIKPPKTTAWLERNLRITPERNSDLLNATITGADPEAVVAIANTYAHEAVRYTEEMQGKAADEVGQYLSHQLADLEKKIGELNEKARSLPMAALPLSGMPVVDSTGAPLVGAAAAVGSPLVAKWQEAQTELVDLLARYMDAHPKVANQKSKVKFLEGELGKMGIKFNESGEISTAAAPAVATKSGNTGNGNNSTDGSNNSTNAAAASPPPLIAAELLRGQLQAMETARLTLAARVRATEMFKQKPAGFYRVFAEATPRNVITKHPGPKIAALALLGAFFGFAGAAGVVVGAEFVGRQLRTAQDVERVTGLPVLAALENLKGLEHKKRMLAGFRAWTAVQYRLSPSPNHGLVCGVISSGPGEGRSTWIHLLAEAASQQGFRVLTIATSPSNPNEPRKLEAPAPRPQKEPVETSVSTDSALSTVLVKSQEPPMALTTNVLATPAVITERFMGPDAPPILHIPLPGWVWNLEKRKQWHSALKQWHAIDNLVILVELPPASVPEGILLAQNLPNLIWLTDSDRASASETRQHLQTLKNARCRFAGAVLNRGPSSPLASWFPRWMECRHSVPA